MSGAPPVVCLIACTIVARNILIGERRRKVAPDERIAAEIKYLLVRITEFSAGGKRCVYSVTI